MAKRAAYDIIESAMIRCRARDDRAAADILYRVLCTLPGYQRRIAAMARYSESLSARDALSHEFRAIVGAACELISGGFRVGRVRRASTGSMYCTVVFPDGRNVTLRHADHEQPHAPEDVIDVPMRADAIAVALSAHRR